MLLFLPNVQASRDDIINFIVSHYGFGQSQAKYAAILFLHLCQTYGIEMAEDLKKKAYKFSGRKRKEKTKENPQKKANKKGVISETDFPMENNNLVSINIKAPGINYSLTANTKEEFEEIVTTKLNKVIAGVRSFLELSFNNQSGPEAKEPNADLSGSSPRDENSQ